MDLFRRADTFYPAPTLTLGLARSFAEQGKVVEAWESYHRIVGSVAEGFSCGGSRARESLRSSPSPVLDGYLGVADAHCNVPTTNATSGPVAPTALDGSPSDRLGGMVHTQTTPLTSLDVVGLVSVGAAVVTQVAWFVHEGKLRLNVDAFGEQLRKLVMAGNPERALKLTQAAAGRPAGDLAHAILEARAGHSHGLQWARPEALARARRGLVGVSVLSCVALVPGGIALAADLAAGPASSPVLLGIALVALVGLSVRNGMRWNGWQVELNKITQSLGDM